LASVPCHAYASVFFINGTATSELYTLSLHDALPISAPAALLPGVHLEHVDRHRGEHLVLCGDVDDDLTQLAVPTHIDQRVRGERSEEHTSELQSRGHLVCRLLLEKKKPIRTGHSSTN